MCRYAIKGIDKGNLMSRGNIMGIGRVKRQEKFERRQSLRGNYYLEVVLLESIFQGEFN